MCQIKLDTYSPYYGPKPSTQSRVVDHTPRVSNGQITRLTVYFQSSCVVGFKVRFGSDPKNTFTLGSSTASGVKNVTASLESSEFINKVVVRASTK